MRSRRVVLLLLALGFLGVGVWAAAMPTSFFTDFPADRGWVGADGPYNEHLVRDVGMLHLALAVLTLAAWRFPEPRWIRVVALATLVFAAPHWLYHAVNLEPLAAADASAQTALLTLQVAAAVWLLGWPAPRRASASAPVDPSRHAEREPR
jgi:hypothetical protein